MQDWQKETIIAHSTLTALLDSVNNSRYRMQPFREKQRELVRQFVGYNYSYDGAYAPVPVNLIETASVVYMQNLFSQMPQATVSSPYDKFYEDARDIETDLNDHIENLDLDLPIGKAVLNSLFSLGVVKVGEQLTGDIEVDEVMIPMGDPYALPVHIDDFVMDMEARDMHELRFIGNRYRMDFELAVTTFGYNQAAQDQLQPTSTPTRYNEFGDERTETMSMGQSVRDRSEFKPHVELWDLYLPREGLLITVPAESAGLQTALPTVLKARIWKGPPRKANSMNCGPFHLLWHNDVPGNFFPLSPMSVLNDLHDLANTLFRKIARQALRQKTNLLVQDYAISDGERIINADDGVAITTNNADGVREVSWGGPDQAGMAAFIMAKDEFDIRAGNLSVMGGTAPGSDTVGQDQMMQSASSKRLQRYQQRIHRFTRGIIHDIAWYRWHDPFVQNALTKKYEGTNIEIPIVFTPQDRQGVWEDYRFDIVPYSMVERTPQEQLQVLNSILMNHVYPNLEMMMSQGITVDLTAFVEEVARLTNYNHLPRILKTGQGTWEPPPQREGNNNKPANTSRTYTRVNRPGANVQGKNQAMISSLMGANQQPAEQAQIARQAG